MRQFSSLFWHTLKMTASNYSTFKPTKGSLLPLELNVISLQCHLLQDPSPSSLWEHLQTHLSFPRCTQSLVLCFCSLSLLSSLLWQPWNLCSLALLVLQILMWPPPSDLNVVTSFWSSKLPLWWAIFRKALVECPWLRAPNAFHHPQTPAPVSLYPSSYFVACCSIS